MLSAGFRPIPKSTGKPPWIVQKLHDVQEQALR